MNQKRKYFKINWDALETKVAIVVGIMAIIAGVYKVFSTPPFCTPATHNLEQVQKVQEALIVEFSNKKSKYTSVKDYFFKVNDHVIHRLKAIQTKKSSITYIPAEAGYGKSWIGVGMIENFLTEDSISIIDIKEDLIERDTMILSQLGFTLIQLNELRISKTNGNEIVLNKMPSFQEAPLKILNLCDTTKKYIIIDGLDEIHPTKAIAILEAVERNNQLLNKHFIILARPECFDAFNVNGSVPKDAPNKMKLASLKAPRLESIEDVKTRVVNWINYYPIKNKVNKLSSRDSLRVLMEFIQVLKDKKFLRFSVFNGANGLDIIELLAGDHQAAQTIKTNSKYEVMKLLSTGILARNSSTHNRPQLGDNNLDIYLAALAKIACEYSDDLDDSGYFRVPSTDLLYFTLRDQDYKFTPKAVLNYSGLIKMKPVPGSSAYVKYSFQPLWLHEYLIHYAKENCIE